MQYRIYLYDTYNDTYIADLKRELSKKEKEVDTEIKFFSEREINESQEYTDKEKDLIKKTAESVADLKLVLIDSDYSLLNTVCLNYKKAEDVFKSTASKILVVRFPVSLTSEEVPLASRRYEFMMQRMSAWIEMITDLDERNNPKKTLINFYKNQAGEERYRKYVDLLDQVVSEIVSDILKVPYGANLYSELPEITEKSKWHDFEEGDLNK